MIDLKPYGAFIEHTLRPFIEEMRWFIKECEKKGIKVTESNIKKVLKQLAKLHIITTVIEAVKQVLILGLICLTAYVVLQS